MSWSWKTSKIWSFHSALYEEYDSDHQHRRHLVPPAIIAGRSRVSVCLERLAPAPVEVMDAGQQQDQHDLRLEPARGPPVAAPGQQQPQDPDRTLGRLHDRIDEPPLHDLEGLALLGTLLGIGVIDEQPGQIEEPRHPGDYRHDVERLQDFVKHYAAPATSGQPRCCCPQGIVVAPWQTATCGVDSTARTRLARPAMKLGCVPTVGTRV